MNTREKAKEWILGMRKYFQVHKYSSEMKSHLAIYNLNGKVARLWRNLKYTKKNEVREIRWSNFSKNVHEKYMLERFFDRKVK